MTFAASFRTGSTAPSTSGATKAAPRWSASHRRRRTCYLCRFIPTTRLALSTGSVAFDGFVDYQSNRYAVPYDHVTDFVPLRITERELFVYAADFTCIACYELAERGGHHDIDPHGFHRRQGQAAVALDKVRQTYEGIGGGAADFFKRLSDGPARSWSAPARRILTLRQRYATEDVDAALGHAARYGALAYDSVERILEARFRPRRLDEYVAAETAHQLQQRLGYRQTERSDLVEYDRLPGAKHQHQEKSDANDTPDSNAGHKQAC
jgi:hypothetical protein